MTEPLKEVIGSVLGVSPQSLSDDSSIENVEAWDSLRQLSILLALESAYGITISTDEAIDMNSISAIRALLDKHGVELPT
ncbi:MAG: acyl carrier protein [Phycisphaerae bacterium]|nr:acyl carrier protein [Phycisphaerae bacterium]